MPPDIDIRPYAATDEAHLLTIWNEAMWADPITATIWRSRYLLDPNFVAGACPVAIDTTTGDPVGFVLGFTGQDQAAPDQDTPRDAWVVGFGVRESHQRQGIGTALMQALEDRWREAGIGHMLFGPYVPGYVTPGVDVAAYADGVAFLEAIGADEGARPLSMKANLTGYRPRSNVGQREADLATAGIAIRPAGPTDILPLIQFLEEHFPHWKGDAIGVLQDLFGGDPRGVSMRVALDHGDIIGYAQTRNERFGPFGVNENYRGQGVGAVLLSRTLRGMRAQGFHCAWFLWTSDRTAKLYHQHGFKEVRRFAMVSKTLDSLDQ